MAVVRGTTAARLWSRRGTDLTGAFPDIAAAAEFHLQPGTVLDGEAVIWADGRLSFDHLHQRLVRRASRGASPGLPASYVAFDVLALDGHDQRNDTYRARRARLEQLAARWAPPLQLCPSTANRDEALTWASDYRAAGIEGLVIKPAASRYTASRSDWIKVKNRESRDVIVGAVTGPITAPTAVIAGLIRDGQLIVAGRTNALTAAQSRELAALLVRPATITRGRRDRLRRVRPTPTHPDHQSATTTRARGRRRPRHLRRPFPTLTAVPPSPGRPGPRRRERHPLARRFRHGPHSRETVNRALVPSHPGLGVGVCRAPPGGCQSPLSPLILSRQVSRGE
jgi:ATP dependent DNA ligase domain